jgi:phenylpropionate dioxygenase-like ring-hydroxylating dioxygenase large terminal subunit
MLSLERNEDLCRVGPGTKMGNLMREYWVPALRCDELPEPDCEPVRVMLLGERLIAFRDSSGRVGLLPNACPHRGASLFFARNEQDGLRCPYHGWKFDVQGRCVDMPNEPPDSNFKDKVRAGAYPCVERAGLVWTYMGPREEPPPMPDFEVFDYPDEQLTHTTYTNQCNWVQAMEGDNDPTHFGFLHVGHADVDDVPDHTYLQAQVYDRRPGQKLLDTPAGLMVGRYHKIPDDEQNLYWGLGHWLFPFYTFTSVGVLGMKVAMVARVPMDDEHTITFAVLVDAAAQRPAEAVGRKQVGFAVREYTHLPLEPNTVDWYGRFRWKQNEENDYLIDREKQRSGASFTGIDGNIIEDVAITESMGPFFDRRTEHVGVADVGIVQIRRRLLDAANALAEEGVTPPGVDDPSAYLQRAGAVKLPIGADWIEQTEALRAPRVQHADLSGATLYGTVASST